MTTGGVTAFLFYMVMLVGNFGILAGVFGNIAKVLGASDKIVVLMMREPAINTKGGRRLEDEGVAVKGDIKIDNIKFNYPSKPDVQVLKGVSIEVDSTKKRVIALCGQSGCGKSSIISLMERFYDPNEGSIQFCGTNIKDLEPRWYHQ